MAPLQDLKSVGLVCESYSQLEEQTQICSEDMQWQRDTIFACSSGGKT